MKTGSKRRSGAEKGSGTGFGTGLGVLDAPEPGYAPETGMGEAGRAGHGAGAAGTLRRPYSGYAGSGYGAEGSVSYGAAGGAGEASGEDYGVEETPYRARRGGLKVKLRRLPRSLGGRILLGAGLLAVLGGVAAAVVGVRYYVVHDPRFVVATSEDIQITGDAHLSRDQVLNVFGDDIERNVFRIPLDARRAQLEQLPWVAHATVMRLLPNQIRVAVTERTPVAFVRQGTQIGLVDASGVLLDMPEKDAGDPSYSFPVLTGISAGDPLSTRAARMEIYRQFMGDLDSGSPNGGQRYSQTVSEVDVSDPEDVRALVTSGGTDILVHFGQQDFLARYQLFEQHLPDWKQQYPQLASADMRYEGQIVLEMQKGAAAPVAGDAAGVAVKTSATATANASAKTNADSSASLRNDKPKGKTAKAEAGVKAKAGVRPVRVRAGGGVSASNERMFAALAAQRKAAAANAVKRSVAAARNTHFPEAGHGAPRTSAARGGGGVVQ